MADWNLNYPEYIIGDGGPDLSVGEVFDWSVEFWSTEPLRQSTATLRTATSSGDYCYRVNAEIAYLDSKSAVIGFGIIAVGRGDRLPEGAKLGDFVTGEVGLGLPLCFEIIPHDVIQN